MIRRDVILAVSNDYMLKKQADGTYVAGCRGPWSKEEALSHWRDVSRGRGDGHDADAERKARARKFIRAINADKPIQLPAKTVAMLRQIAAIHRFIDREDKLDLAGGNVYLTTIGEELLAQSTPQRRAKKRAGKRKGSR